MSRDMIEVARRIANLDSALYALRTAEDALLSLAHESPAIESELSHVLNHLGDDIATLSKLLAGAKQEARDPFGKD